jgi:hypothetical protein
MPSNRNLGRSAAQRAFRIVGGELSTLYNKGYSAHDIMEQTHLLLSKFGLPERSNIRSRLCVALWNLAPRASRPSIEDMLANREQFSMWDYDNG